MIRVQHRLGTFKNSLLRRIFGPKKDKVTCGWRRLHNAELNDMNSTPNIIWVFKSRRKRLDGHVA
jgi:hypothetical protein